MAEAALGVASSIVSLVSLTGQSLQGIKFLVTFFNDVKNCPRELQDLERELETLLPVLASMHRDPNIPEGFRTRLLPTLRECNLLIGALVDLVKEYQTGQDESRGKKLLKQVWQATRRSHLVRCTERLERWKSTLSIVQGTISSEILERQYTQLQAVADSTSNLCTVVEGTSKSMSDIERRVGHIEGIFNNPDPRNKGRDQRIPTWLQATIEATIMQTVEKYNAPLNITTSSIENDCFPSIDQPSPLDDMNNHSKLLTASMNSMRAKERRLMLTQSYHCWFGSFTLEMTETTTSEEEGRYLLTQRARQTRVILIPARWLFSTGAVMSFRKVYSEFMRPSFQLQFRTFSIVSSDSAIIEATRDLNIETIHRLFSHGKASPFVRDQFGDTLMDVLSSELGPMSQQQSRYCNNNIPRSSQAEEIQKALEIVRLLINCGVDPAESRGPYGSSLYNLCFFHRRGTPEGDLMQDLLKITANRALNNPFDCWVGRWPPGAGYEVHWPSLFDFFTQISFWQADWGFFYLNSLYQTSFLASNSTAAAVREYWETLSKPKKQISKFDKLSSVRDHDRDRSLIKILCAIHESQKALPGDTECAALIASHGVDNLVFLLQHGANPRYAPYRLNGRWYSPTVCAEDLAIGDLWRQALEVSGFDAELFFAETSLVVPTGMYSGSDEEAWTCRASGHCTVVVEVIANNVRWYACGCNHLNYYESRDGDKIPDGLKKLGVDVGALEDEWTDDVVDDEEEEIGYGGPSIVYFCRSSDRLAVVNGT